MILPQAPENSIRVHFNFFRKFVDKFTSQGALLVANFATGAAGVNDTSGKISTGAVSMIPAENFHRYQ
jgi:hypothetical protein